MSTENELKFVLATHTNEDDFIEPRWKKIPIRQGYLDGNRIRQYGNKFLFTYKKWIDEEDILVEIETKIDETTFKRLWDYTSNHVIKNRYIFNPVGVSDEEWVVDFLQDDDGEVFFVMAEVEMPDGRAEPSSVMPDLIDLHLIYEVEMGDERFTNKKLAKIKKAKKLLRKIEDGVI